jgi:hypothetical protein
MNWIKFVEKHESPKPKSSFKPACGNTYYAGKGTGTLYGLVGE